MWRENKSQSSNPPFATHPPPRFSQPNGLYEKQRVGPDPYTILDRLMMPKGFLPSVALVIPLRSFLISRVPKDISLEDKIFDNRTDIFAGSGQTSRADERYLFLVAMANMDDQFRSSYPLVC